MGMKRYQGGAIISFIIVTVVLAALVIGGVFWLRQRGEVARQSTDPATQHDGAVPPEGVASQEQAREEREQKTTSSEASSQSQSEERSQSSGRSRPAESTGGDSSARNEAKELPETGSAHIFIAMIALGCITYTTVQYVMSRRALTRTTAS